MVKQTSKTCSHTHFGIPLFFFICWFSLMVEQLSCKQQIGVRFPASAHTKCLISIMVVQVVYILLAGVRFSHQVQ